MATNFTNLTNLLPQERIRAFRKSYFFRLAAFSLMVLAVLVVVHGVLLAPTYLFVSERASLARDELLTVSASLASSEEEAMTARLSELATDASRLLTFTDSSAASDLIRALLLLPQNNVVIRGISYMPGTDGGEGRMTITGTAASREALRAYHRALESLPFVTLVDLPLSAYARETDIEFTVTLTGPLSL